MIGLILLLLLPSPTPAPTPPPSPPRPAINPDGINIGNALCKNNIVGCVFDVDCNGNGLVYGESNIVNEINNKYYGVLPHTPKPQAKPLP